MHILIVHAHHEPTSFNAAMTERAVAVLTDAGHQVIVSDLYAMGFDPVSDRRNFDSVANPDRLDQQAEEKWASAQQGFTADLQAEINKLRRADLVIFQFPIWWMAMPAIMKGWIDRVFALGVAYGGGRWFDRGVLAGKKAMLSVTMGGGPGAYSADGVYGSAESVFHPIHRGILGFVGFDVIEPFIVYGPGRMSDDQRTQALADYAARLTDIDAIPVLPQLQADAFENFVRKRQA
ncbi:NAD(P)H-dependent oxidoreductase [Sphingomonas sp. 28-63-12]|uniref:NAD(P)H-dependent oxidoreductase n=1 Tax=Sphingomonas sp. 28-63-12 TaxID=1970434 RepID=UPI000BC7EBFA|nr:MAG: NADPH quinone oxidoreductase [Sphingomonas sp. 28-63-12]